MQPVNPGQQAPTNQQASESQSSHKVSEDQANDFSKRMDKKKNTKGKEGKEEQSLENLMAERRKSSKEALEGRNREGGEGKDGDQSQSMMENMGQIKDTQRASESQLKSIQSVSGPKEINEVINKLVDKIMVSSKDAINGAEVRITLKDNILPGTEIRIQRVSGELQVTMNTSSAESHNFLAANEASLVKSLSERFSDNKVQVNINLSGGDGQPGDGRSRQEYVAEDENKDDNPSS